MSPKEHRGWLTLVTKIRRVILLQMQEKEIIFIFSTVVLGKVSGSPEYDREVRICPGALSKVVEGWVGKPVGLRLRFKRDAFGSVPGKRSGNVSLKPIDQSSPLKAE